MTKKQISLTILGIILAFAIGVLSSEGIKNIISQKQKLVGEKNLAIREKELLKITPINIKKAHNYSVNYRKDAGYCAVDDHGMVTINPKGEGFMNISYDNIKELGDAMFDLRNYYDDNEKPNLFRLINGQLTQGGTNILMVVPLNKNKEEITEIDYTDDSGHYPHLSMIRLLDKQIDCPVNCDFKFSKIILLNDLTNPDKACLIAK